MAETKSNDERGSTRRRRLAAWQIALAALAVVIMLAGLGVRLLAAPDDAVPVPGGAGAGGTALAPGFAPFGGAGGGSEAAPAGEPGTLESISPHLFRLGFCFFVGFAIAYALRSFLKIALVIAGVIALALLGLEMTDLVNIDWTSLSERFETLLATARERADGAWTKMTTVLPSGASATAGLVTGWRRRV